MSGPGDALQGVGLTAFGVAAVRARESRRPDALFHDRASDDLVAAAVAAGVAQVVDLGAGLDTRAWRLDALAGLPWFELDRPAVLAFKDEVLGRCPTIARRIAVPGDLAGDWLGALRTAGLDTSLPTLWFEEGVLAYLSPEGATAVVDLVSAVAATGSRLVKTAIEPPTADDETYRELRRLVPDGGSPSAGVTGVDRDNAHRLVEQGWRVEFVAHADVAARLGRPLPAADVTAAAGSGYVTATR